MATRRRTESGTAALLTALLGVVLIGVGAFAVDLGQAYAKKSLAQTDVDLAVLAAAQELTSGGACNPEVVQTATEYLEKADNRVPGQGSIDLGGTPGDVDGYIRCANWRVDLWAPRADVDYGLAPVLGVDGTQINAHAAAQIKAAAPAASLPFYAAGDCASGPQVVRDDSGGSPFHAPPLTPDSAAHIQPDFTLSPTGVPTGTSSVTLTLTGHNFNGIDSVGFTGAGGPPYHYVVALPSPTAPSTTTITVDVPNAVLAVPGIWWVRVKAGTKWSKASEAQPFSVGPPTLYCNASYEGNFGTIVLPRTDTNSFTLQWNIAKGIQPKLAEHPAPNGQCAGLPGSVVSTTTPVDGTNCVYTEPGLKIAETNEGLVTGKGGVPGRLDTDSTSNCSRNHDNSRTAATISGKHINDDLLTCFITNGAHISDLVHPDLTPVGRGALSSAIYSSPRFFWVPVLAVDPMFGRKAWPIIGFRPGFLTDQDVTATHDSPGTISALDGLETAPSGIRAVHVVLFDESALSEFVPAQGGEGDYQGSGPKVVVLVD